MNFSSCTEEVFFFLSSTCLERRLVGDLADIFGDVLSFAEEVFLFLFNCTCFECLTVLGLGKTRIGAPNDEGCDGLEDLGLVVVDRLVQGLALLLDNLVTKKHLTEVG